MRVIIAGSRDIEVSVEALNQIIVDSGFSPTIVVSGTARGPDRLGEEWATKYQIRCEKYPADWDKYGKRAGLLRNECMAANADALIALWDGKSSGTKHMIETMRKSKLPIFIWRIDDHHTGTAYKNTEVQKRRSNVSVVRTTGWDI